MMHWVRYSNKKACPKQSAFDLTSLHIIYMQSTPNSVIDKYTVVYDRRPVLNCDLLMKQACHCCI